MIINLTEEEKKVLEILDKLGLSWERLEHPPVFTLEESSLYWKGWGGAHCKNLFLRNYKGNRHYLLIVRGDKKVDLKKLTCQLEEDRLSLASEERLKKYLGVNSGAVSPFGLINDPAKEVRVILDRDLLEESELNFHPNVNTSTVRISRNDFLKFLEWTGHEFRFLPIGNGG